jgi:hypothetical protein
MPPLARSSLGRILGAQSELEPATDVPPRNWVTGQLHVDRDTVLPDASSVLMGWTDSQGRLLGTPRPALFQHVLGPSIPAYRVLTPAQPGDYQLVFLDEHHRRLAAKPYRVTSTLRTSRQSYPGRIPEITVNTVTAESEPGSVDPLLITLENSSNLYVQTLAENPATCRSIMADPGLVYPGPGSLNLWIHVEENGDEVPQELNLAMPHDLPPHGKLTLTVPADRLASASGRARFTITPNFAQLGCRRAAAEVAVVRLSLRR